MNPIKFSDIKNELQIALQEKLRQSPIPDEAGFTFIEGFMTLSLQSEVSSSIVIGGPIIPTVDPLCKVA